MVDRHSGETDVRDKLKTFTGELTSWISERHLDRTNRLISSFFWTGYFRTHAVFLKNENEANA